MNTRSEFYKHGSSMRGIKELKIERQYMECWRNPQIRMPCIGNQKLPLKQSSMGISLPCRLGPIAIRVVERSEHTRYT